MLESYSSDILAGDTVPPFASNVNVNLPLPVTAYNVVLSVN
ncbi:unknown [Clostridium sp. CAG:921]|nr:unknown [Clostridium sp. CAG:921]